MSDGSRVFDRGQGGSGVGGTERGDRSPSADARRVKAQGRRSWVWGGSDTRKSLSDNDVCVQVELQLVLSGSEAERHVFEPTADCSIDDGQNQEIPLGLVLASFCHVPALQKLVRRVRDLQREVRKTSIVVPPLPTRKKSLEVSHVVLQGRSTGSP